MSSSLPPRSRHGLHGRGVALLLALPLLLSAKLATAQGAAVLPDLSAPPELAEQAAAVSMLFRSYLKTGERKLIPRHELSLAIEAFTGRTPRGALLVPPEVASRLADQLGADRILVAELSQSGKRLMATGVIYGPSGKRLARLSVAAAVGEVSNLAHLIAKRVAPIISAEVLASAAVGLADLRPFLNAQVAMLAGEAQTAARALDVALPNTAARIPAALEVLRSLAEEPGLPAPTRVQARLLMNDWSAAAELADESLVGQPKNIPLRAAKLRAKAALRDFAAADAEAVRLKAQRNHPAVAVALAALAVERGDPVAKRDEALAPLVGRPPSEWRTALALLTAYPPGTFGPAIENAALAAAQKLAAQEPGLAALVATRALTGGASPTQAAPLIKVQDLSNEQVKAVSAQLDRAGPADQTTATLSQEIRSRQEESERIQIMERSVQRPTGPPSTLSANLRPLLQKLDPLYEPSLTSITIAALPGSGQPFYWPFLVRRERLAEGLLESLMRQPWELQASRSRIRVEDLPPNRATEDALEVLAHDMGDQAVLMYRIRPAGLAPWVNVDLLLFDLAKQKIHRVSSPLIGRSTGLVMINPVLAGLCILIVLATVVWAIIISFRGSIAVRVQWDPDSKEELFSILISRSNKTPEIDNPAAYKKKLEWLGQRKRRFEAWHVERSTTFRGIRKGKYFVHLYGIYTRGRQTLVLSEPCEAVEVQPRKTAFVAFNLEASEADFKITVVDDHGTVEGARVWLDKETKRPAVTTKDSPVTLKVPKGYHVIHVSAKGIEVERPYHVIKAKVHEMTINLVWERRQEHASRALERQEDDASPYMTAANRTRSPHQPGADGTHVAKRKGTPASAIEIPLAGGPAAGAPAGSIQGPLTRPAQPHPASAPPRPSQGAPNAPSRAGASPSPAMPTAPAQRPPAVHAPGKSPAHMSLQPLAPQPGLATRSPTGNHPTEAPQTGARPATPKTAAQPSIDLVRPGPPRTR